MEECISFFTVLAVAVLVAGSIGTLYASGLRLWAQGSLKKGATGVTGSQIASRIFSVVCFSSCVIIVLFALWLMIPLFH